MAKAHLVPAIFSSLHRLSAYVFLKIIPTTIGPLVLPVFYVAYLISLVLCPAADSPTPAITAPVQTSQDTKEANGDAKNIKEEKPLPPPPVTQPKQPSLVPSLLFSLKTRNWLPNALNVAINTILFAACVDLTLNPVFYPETDVAFARVGAVYPDAAKITVRFPSSEVTQQDVRILYREADSPLNGWKDGPVLSVSEEFDWVNTTRLKNLWPETVYEYTFSDMNRTLVDDAVPQRFQTFPDARFNSGSHFKFLVSSCITPNFPYKGPQERLMIKGFDLLAKYLTHEEESTEEAVNMTGSVSNTTTADEPVAEQNATVPEVAEEQVPLVAPESAPSASSVISNLYKFMLFLGDFVYADVPFYYGDDKDAYLRLYRRNYASPSFQKVYRNLPVFYAYDDHEIFNNYGGEGIDVAPYANATNGFSLYNGDANYDPTVQGDHYYNFSYGDTAFFVFDTRRYRSNIDTTAPQDRTMLGPVQLEAFHNWLARVNQTATFKFVVSSVPFTSLWGHDAQLDSWAAFAREKNQVLKALQSVPNVVILSGDRHEFAVIEYAVPQHSEDKKGYVVREYSASPLNMFYIPFVKTLRMESEDVVVRRWNETRLTEEGPVVEEKTELVPKERVLQYIPVGNVKWSSIEVDTRNQSHPVLRLEAVIDGKTAYQLETIGTPVNHNNGKALISVPLGLKHFLGKLGFQSKRWF
ncbi:alkaline phosphatase [Coprinopsis cinerea okayama7|uniref:Alkaline phosphatase n=1 Tax=Coprinopsis cinerea (strain Okayama-7 / 130 / ATCC MYA-4618 / FGSC 9003) TaxID=240176 RepID=A8NGL8_COPC7|nr:alkaline phosphatase [Coprinopsis cinerea okayama7\|eukprot:XP_001833554.1 alkaline phosphatase [Coprinopsis cinerea okayama7\